MEGVEWGGGDRGQDGGRGGRGGSKEKGVRGRWKGGRTGHRDTHLPNRLVGEGPLVNLWGRKVTLPHLLHCTRHHRTLVG